MPVESRKYSVILPTYNERENLPIIIYQLINVAQQYDFELEIIIIEDSSPDGTYEVALQLQQLYGQDKIVYIYEKKIIHKRGGKFGLGSAYMDGLELCSGNFVIIMDSDLSHQPKYIADFIKKQQETDCDIVTGSRYINGGGVVNWGFTRKLVSRGANFLATTTLGSNCSDLTGSFRLYKKEVLQRIISDVISKGYAFQMEIIIRSLAYGYKLEEVPIVFVERIYGESKLGASEFSIYLKGVWYLLRTF